MDKAEISFGIGFFSYEESRWGGARNDVVMTLWVIVTQHPKNLLARLSLSKIRTFPFRQNSDRPLVHASASLISLEQSGVGILYNRYWAW